MTQELLARLIDQLEKALGPVIASLVLRIIVREAKLKFTEEQKAQLNANRLKALEAVADEIVRAGD
jgi:hypothetical protein